MNKKIHVIKVLDDLNLVINIGSDDGVTEEFEFLVYQLDEELFDPDTNESLGKLELVKGKGIPQHIQKQVTTIRSNSYKKVESRKIIKKSHNTGLANFLGAPQEEIIEPSESLTIPFKDPKKGDLVKITRTQRKLLS